MAPAIQVPATKAQFEAVMNNVSAVLETLMKSDRLNAVAPKGKAGAPTDDRLAAVQPAAKAEGQAGHDEGAGSPGSSVSHATTNAGPKGGTASGDAGHADAAGSPGSSVSQAVTNAGPKGGAPANKGEASASGSSFSKDGPSPSGSPGSAPSGSASGSMSGISDSSGAPQAPAGDPGTPPPGPGDLGQPQPGQAGPGDAQSYAQEFAQLPPEELATIAEGLALAIKQMAGGAGPTAGGPPSPAPSPSPTPSPSGAPMAASEKAFGEAMAKSEARIGELEKAIQDQSKATQDLVTLFQKVIPGLQPVRKAITDVAFVEKPTFDVNAMPSSKDIDDHFRKLTHPSNKSLAKSQRDLISGYYQNQVSIQQLDAAGLLPKKGQPA